MSFKFNTWLEYFLPSPFSVFFASAAEPPEEPETPAAINRIVYDRDERLKPKITFEVNLSNLVVGSTADTRDDYFNNISQITIFLSEIDRPLRHGDRVVLYGTKAVRVKQIYQNANPNYLRIISID